MSEITDPSAGPGRPAPSAWDDWITIWQSEWAALAADREVAEALQRGVDLWAAAARDAAGRAGPAAPQGAAAPVDAPDRPAGAIPLRPNLVGATDPAGPAGGA